MRGPTRHASLINPWRDAPQHRLAFWRRLTPPHLFVAFLLGLLSPRHHRTPDPSRTLLGTLHQRVVMLDGCALAAPSAICAPASLSWTRRPASRSPRRCSGDVSGRAGAGRGRPACGGWGERWWAFLPSRTSSCCSPLRSIWNGGAADLTSGRRGGNARPHHAPVLEKRARQHVPRLGIEAREHRDDRVALAE